MAGVRPIPKRLLPDEMFVRVPDGCGGFEPPVRVGHVRFERTQNMVDDEHRSADAGAGTVYIDAMNSRGAFEIPAGSRVCIHGGDMVVAGCKRLCGANGRVHHWELEVR